MNVFIRHSIVCKGIIKYVKDGEVVEVDLENEKVIINDGIVSDCEVPRGVEREILEAGGLINYYHRKVKKRYAKI